MNRRTGYKQKYNQQTYASHLYRVRHDTDLAAKLADFKEQGRSLNWLITELLCDHFGVAIPHRYKFEREVTKII